MAEDDPKFAREMGDVRPLKTPNRARLGAVATRDASLQARRQAAITASEPDPNVLSAEHAPPVGPHDILSFVRPGVQHGVFHKLRRGRYPAEASLDLHRHTVEQARRELWEFIQQCEHYQLRTVMVVHGKGDRAPNPGVLKSFVAHWLVDLPQVLAYHSAQPRDGGSGALYVMLKKSEAARDSNRERFLNRRQN